MFKKCFNIIMNKSFLFFSRVTQLDILDLINFLRIDNKLRIKWVKLLGFFKILSSLIIFLKSFVRKCTSEVSMTILRLHFYK